MVLEYCSQYTNSLNCVLEYNNLLTIKISIFAILFLYSFFGLYLYREWDFKGSNFDIFKVLIFRVFSYMYFFFSPLLMVFLLRFSVDFELFIFLISIFYMIVSILFMAGGLMFGYKSIVGIFSKENMMKYQERIKYGKQDD